MSQYPNPPQPFQPSYYSQQAPGTHPALMRAALFLFIIGGLMALSGFCFSSFMAIAPLELLEQAVAQQQKTMSEPVPINVSALKTVFVILFVVVAVIGVIHFALGFGVRKGNVPAIMAALVVTGITLLILLLLVFRSLFTIAMNPVAGIFDFVLIGLPAIAMVFQFISLRKARTVAAGGLTSAQQQFQMQMWQHQQMQQAYGQQYPQQQPGGQPPAAGGAPGYGYGYGYGAVQQQPPQSPQPQQQPQTPPPSSPSNPAGGSDVPPRQE